MCDHKMLRTVGDEVFCQDCGAKLTLDFLAGQKAEKTGSEAAPRRRVSKSSAKEKSPETGK